jgi:hypothetical protein
MKTIERSGTGMGATPNGTWITKVTKKLRRLDDKRNTLYEIALA